MMMTNENNVLVKFYARRRCGHCKKLVPVYKLGKKKADKPADIAKMDTTANDIPTLR